MTSPEGTLELFRAVGCKPDEEIDLVEGALIIAQGEYPDLDHAAYRARLDEMGREALAVCTGSTTERLAELSRLFSFSWGFRGNRKDYYDPRNSFLNDVLDRRTGIPITLSLVYMEVGRRAGLDLVGVGMPGHFLVGCRDRRDLHVDAFSEGAILTTVDCIALQRELRPDVRFDPQYLDPVGPRLILTRVLNNLFQIYIEKWQSRKALDVLEMIFCLQTDEAEWLRQRALIHYQLKNYTQAIADLQAYLERVPGAGDRDEVARQLAALQQLRNVVN